MLRGMRNALLDAGQARCNAGEVQSPCRCALGCYSIQLFPTTLLTNTQYDMPDNMRSASAQLPAVCNDCARVWPSGIVLLPEGQRVDGIYDVKTLNHFAENGVAAIQVRRRPHENRKMAGVGVVTHVSHRQQTLARQRRRVTPF